MNWSFQLFSARNTPLADALSIVSKAGYSGVEAYRDNYTDVTEFKRLLDSNTLAVSSMHINLDALRAEHEDYIKLAKEFGCSHIVCPYLDVSERPADSSGWIALVAELSDIAKRWRDAGFTFAWHNHDFEFQTLADGIVPMQLILEGAPEMQWEIDVAWIVRGQSEPANWIASHTSRISAVHLKDIAPNGECLDEDGWADFGHGVVPWTSIMPLLAKAPASVYAVEHDNPSDLRRFATRAIETASSYNSILAS